MAKSAAQKEPSYDELKERLAQLEKQVQSPRTLSYKVSPKGGVSVYGLGRFPVTLYYEQWLTLLAAADTINKFLETNKGSLKMKETR